MIETILSTWYATNTGPAEALHNWSGQTLPCGLLNEWAADTFTTADIFFYQSYYNVIGLIGLQITLLLCLLLSFLHNRILFTHNVLVADNLTPLDMLFISIIV